MLKRMWAETPEQTPEEQLKTLLEKFQHRIFEEDLDHLEEEVIQILNIFEKEATKQQKLFRLTAHMRRALRELEKFSYENKIDSPMRGVNMTRSLLKKIQATR